MVKQKLRKELQRVLDAFIFYTIIPFPSKWYSVEKLNSSRYFSLVGCAVGLVSASVFIIPEIFSGFGIISVLTVNMPVPEASIDK